MARALESIILRYPAIPNKTPVRILKGTLLRSTHPQKDGPYPAGRTYTINSFGSSGCHERDVVWPGAGGYWTHASKWDAQVQGENGNWSPILHNEHPAIKAFLSDVLGARVTLNLMDGYTVPCHIIGHDKGALQIKLEDGSEDTILLHDVASVLIVNPAAQLLA